VIVVAESYSCQVVWKGEEDYAIETVAFVAAESAWLLFSLMQMMTLYSAPAFVMLATEMRVLEVVARAVLRAEIELGQRNIFSRSPASQLRHPGRQCE
jgi:hypothetical protein